MPFLYIGSVQEFKTGIYNFHQNFMNSVCKFIILAAGFRDVRPLWHNHWHT